MADLVVVDAHRDELGQPGVGLVEHSERAVAGVDELGRRLRDAPEDDRQIQLGPDGQHSASSRRSCFGPAAQPPGSECRCIWCQGRE